SRLGSSYVGISPPRGCTPGNGRQASPLRARVWGRSRSALHRPGVMGDVLADEAGDEVVAVVVAGADAKAQRMARRLAGGLQQLRAQLAVEEFVAAALVDQQRQPLRRGFHQFHRVVPLPGLAVI